MNFRVPGQNKRANTAQFFAKKAKSKKVRFTKMSICLKHRNNDEGHWSLLS